MPDALTTALAAARRSETLLSVVDREHRSHQVYEAVRAVQTELAAVVRELTALGADVTVARGGKVGRDHPETSRAAARAITTRSGSQRHRILIALGQRPRADHELQRDVGVVGSSERPRRLELVEAGYVRAAVGRDIAGWMDRPAAEKDDPVTRENPDTGQQCTVWTITEAGRAALRQLEAGQMVIFEPGDLGI